MGTEPVVVDPEQVADVLEAAADYIDEHGWVQGEVLDSFGRVCVLGALIKTNNRLRFVTEATLDSTVAPIHVLTWNDAPGREQWEVDELLRTTAKKVRHGDLSVG